MPDWFDLLQSGDWFQATFGPYFALLSEPGVTLLLGTPLTLALWIQTDSLYVPGTLLVLFVGLIVGGAPPAASLAGYLIIVAAVVLAYRSIYSSGRPM